MKNNDDAVVVEIDEKQIDLKLDPDGEVKLPVKDDEVKPEAKADKSDKPARVDRSNDDAMESLQQQLAALRAERDAERAARAEAEALAAKNASTAHNAKYNALVSRYDMINGHIAAAESRESSIKKEIRAALEAGDAEKAADLQMEAARVAARKLQYEDSKADIEAAAQRAKAENEERAARHAEQPAPQTQHADPFEARIASLSEPSKAWLRNHRECVSDAAMNAKVMWAHEDAMKNGLRPDSPQYFAHLEMRMGYGEESDDGDNVEIVDAKPSGRAPAAPVSRGQSRPDPRTGHLGNNRYQLSREEADMAAELGMTPTEYATYKIKALKEGRYANN